MKKLLIAIAVLALMAAGPVPAGEGVTPMLKMETTYNFVFGSEFIPTGLFVERTENDLWALAWEGTV